MNKSRSPITTHILDVSLGKAAAGVAVKLELMDSSHSWREISSRSTNGDGRVEDLLPVGSQAAPGIYRISFQVETYFESQGKAGFYPVIEIQFKLNQPSEHYHVPLLLSPFGYSTYRGT